MLFLENQLTEIDAQLVLLRDERKRHSAIFGKLIIEHQHTISDITGYFDQRDELLRTGKRRVTGSGNACYRRVFFL